MHIYKQNFKEKPSKYSQNDHIGSHTNHKVEDCEQDRAHGGGCFWIAENDLLGLSDSYISMYSLFWCIS